MNDITALAQSKALHKKLNRRLNDAFGFQRTSGGKHTTISLSIDECKSVIAAFDERLALVEALEKAHRQIAQVTAERDALREGEMGNAKHSNTRAAADIYFQLAEECDIPAGGSLVEFVDGLKERLCVLESRTVTVKLPAEYLNADGSVNADMANTCPVVSAYREAHRTAGIQVIEGEA